MTDQELNAYDAMTDDRDNSEEKEHEAHLLLHVEKWIETALNLDDKFGKLEKLLMAHPENPVRTAIWEMFSEYTKTLAKLLRTDTDETIGWLEWFAWECDFGRKPKEMTFTDGECLLVVGASDLLAAIQSDENGCRVWHA